MSVGLYAVADVGELFIGIGLANVPECVVGAGDGKGDKVVGRDMRYLLSGVQCPEARGHLSVTSSEQ